MQTIKHSAGTHPDRKAERQELSATLKELASATTQMARAAKRLASASVTEKAVSRDAEKGKNTLPYVHGEEPER